MKKLFLLPILVLFFSCEVEGEFTKSVEVIPPISPIATVLYTGNFVPTSGINVAGQAKIISENGSLKLELNEFSVSSGPDLKVYLSKSSSPDDFITLGNLTSARIYSIPNGVNFNEYTHVLIHCQQYNHLFAIAALTQN